MTISETINSALSSVLPNSWADELPVDVTFPAIVFEIDTAPEGQWVQGGEYDQHTVGVVVYAKTKDEIKVLQPQIDAALLLIIGYMFDADRGSANYEDDASVYGFYSNHVIRLRRSEG